MLFNSLDFAIFLPIVFVLYWFVFNKSIKLQNFLIVIASYVFYGWWDWRFLLLIFFSSVVDYSVSIALDKEDVPSRRKLLLWISIAVNIGVLGFFKYYNFFLDNFVSGFKLLGVEFNVSTLSIILPVGISFYTFQTLSYTIDVYRKKLASTKDFIAFTAFVSFFPQLVAGPIERATNLLPQFYVKRTFDYSNAVDGFRQILWGLFKKMVIADRCAEYVNVIFSNYEEYNSLTLVLGAMLFAFQIYGDFSGYSDIAIGTSKLFGFSLCKNFAFPYFSRDIAEFWRRWHISLSSWFKDYIYIPLGGSRGGMASKIRNTFIIFLVSGFWHGANWTFIVWGLLNALYFIPMMMLDKNRNNLEVVASGKIFPSLREFVNVIITFCLASLAWVFFRAENIGDAFEYLYLAGTGDWFQLPNLVSEQYTLITLLAIGFLLVVEWRGREGEFALDGIGLKWKQVYVWSFYYLVIFAIILLGVFKQSQFIYFQF